jgi:hypothetical protein
LGWLYPFPSTVQQEVSVSFQTILQKMFFKGGFNSKNQTKYGAVVQHQILNREDAGWRL